MKGTAMKIFNFHQANFLFKNGCEIINMGYGQKDGKVYIMFQVDEKFNDAMKKWQKRCEERRRNK